MTKAVRPRSPVLLEGFPMRSMKHETPLRSILELPGIGVALVNPRGEILEANAAVCRFLGYPEGGLQGVSVREVTHPDDLERSLRFYAADSSAPMDHFSYRKRYLRRDGQTVWGQVSAVWIPGAQGAPDYGMVLLQDITASQLTQEAITDERNFFQSVVDSLLDPIKVVGLDHQLLAVNAAAKQLMPTDADNHGELLCHQASERCRLPCLASSGCCNLEQIQITGQPMRVLSRYLRESGEETIFEVTAVPLRDAQGRLRGVVETARNMTQLLQAEARVEEHEKRLDYLTHYDLLTRLPNRALLADRLQQTLARAQRSAGRVAVLLLDLDRYKKINDSLGTRAGDLLLTVVAQRLGHHVRQADTLARRGEDEFVVVLEQFIEITQVVEIAQRLLTDLSQQVDLEGVPVFVTASIGISLYPEDAGEAEGLLRCADAAMRRAQAEGGNTCQFYTVDMTAQTRERLELEGLLRQALGNGELSFHYQPQIDLLTGRCIGTEALMRWVHPQRGMISPATFIPLAEETGLIEEIGLWGLKAACAWNRGLQARGLTPIPVAVNISARQLYRADFPEMVAAILEQTGLEARWLELEITESMLMKDVKSAIAAMTRLNRLGISLALDDFGTGYSSLSYLRQFPIEKLKIDQSFIRDLVLDPNARAIAGSIVALAKSLNLRTIAEGVETEEQAAILQALGCHEVQGYWYSRPLPMAAAEAFLQQR